jgi:hypothetical protein
MIKGHMRGGGKKMSNHTGVIIRENINNISRNVCNSISSTATPNSMALMNCVIFMPTVIEERIYISENTNITNLIMLSDADFSIINDNISNPPLPNKALVDLLNACGK